ncbi:MAG: short-chain dehydrogenase [Nitrosarchaeum sp.]|nr:MAG: short-chain dehydrogenase [Nitrosarchaeum sp.]
MTGAIVLGGSRGIGKAISESLKSIGMDVFAASRNDIDTSDLTSVRKFVQIHNNTDVLVLNTGGPAAKEFANITKEEWNKYHNQLFLGFCIILQNIKINDGGYIFLISSSVIKEPNAKLIISSAYRAAFSEVFKILSKDYAAKNISCINIAPGPINTDRTKELIENIEEYKKSLPMKRLGEPDEIGSFVKAIIENSNGTSESFGTSLRQNPESSPNHCRFRSCENRSFLPYCRSHSIQKFGS